jgi:glutamate-5-semialdehyde dehydrogenase
MGGTEIMTQDLGDLITAMAHGARAAFSVSALLSSHQKQNILHQAATFCAEDSNAILKANALDMREAEAGGRNAAYLDRLYLDAGRLRGIQDALHAIADQPDPIGAVLESWDRPNGLHIEKVRIPLGVIGMIYESRPNVTLDAAALCLKSGNTVLLRCGSDSLQTSLALIHGLHRALDQAGITRDVAQVIPAPDRAAVDGLFGPPARAGGSPPAVAHLRRHRSLHSSLERRGRHLRHATTLRLAMGECGLSPLCRLLRK